MAKFGPRVAIALVAVFAVVVGIAVAASASTSHRHSVEMVRSNQAESPTTAAAQVAAEVLTAQSTTTAPTATTTTLPPRPSVIAATSEKGRVVLIDGNTGKTIKVLATYKENYCGTLGRVALTPDSKAVFFSRTGEPSDKGCPPDDLYKVSTAGGTPTLVVRGGSDPEISPDGTKLAYVKGTADGSGYTKYELKLMNVASGTSMDVYADPGCGCSMPAMSWSPDNVHLAYQDINCGCGGQPYETIQIIDTDRPKSPFKEVAMPDALYNKAQWSEPSYRPDGSMFVIEAPSYNFDESKNNFVAGTPAPRMLIIDPTTSKIVSFITTGYQDTYYSDTASDASGQHLLYVRAGTLMASDNLGRPVQLSTGLVSADW